MTVDTACSASLTAIHLACESVLRKECSVALVGGVNLYLHPSKYVWLSQMRMLSPSGKCHSFGAASDGFVPGEGTGAILIKPLMEAVQDGDRIYGVIKATSINHGGRTNGYTVPNPNSQADLVSTALTKANVNPRSISYIEAHGTGTALGDPIEVAGLAKVYGKTFERKSCAIGSVKSNIGHLEAAAGIAGLTKILLQMKHRQLVPSLHAEELNPNISFEDTPFFVQRGLTEWQSNDLERHEPLRAGISSFGAGGSNAHILIEEYVEPSSSNNSATYEEQENPCLVVLSASTEERLNVYASHLLEHLKKHSLNVSNVAFTLQVGRQALEHRLALIVRSREELVHKLEDFINPHEKNG